MGEFFSVGVESSIPGALRAAPPTREKMPRVPGMALGSSHPGSHPKVS